MDWDHQPGEVRLQYQHIYTSYFKAMLKKLLPKQPTRPISMAVAMCVPTCATEFHRGKLQESFEQATLEIPFSFDYEIFFSSKADAGIESGAHCAVEAYPDYIDVIMRDGQRTRLNFGTNLVVDAICKTVEHELGLELLQKLIPGLYDGISRLQQRFNGDIKLLLAPDHRQSILEYSTTDPQLMETLAQTSLIRVTNTQLTIKEVCCFAAVDEFCRWFVNLILPMTRNAGLVRPRIIFTEPLSNRIGADVLDAYFRRNDCSGNAEDISLSALFSHFIHKAAAYEAPKPPQADAAPKNPATQVSEHTLKLRQLLATSRSQAVYKDEFQHAKDLLQTRRYEALQHTEKDTVDPYLKAVQAHIQKALQSSTSHREFLVSQETQRSTGSTITASQAAAEHREFLEQLGASRSLRQ